MALPNTQQAYADYLASQQKYQKQQTGGASFLQALQAALAGADQQNTALRQQQQTLTQQQFETPTKYREELIGQGITDPYRRQSLLDVKLGNVAGNLQGVQGKLADLGGQREQVLGTAGKAYDAETQAALQQAQSAGDFFKQLLNQDQAREQMLAQQKFQARNDDLERRQMEASINAANRSNRGGGAGGISPLDLFGLQKSNPLALAQLKGYTRELAPGGGLGYWFYRNNPDGTRTPVKVDEVANAIGGNKAALLEGSTNPADILVSGKPPSETAKRADNNAQSGLRSLAKIESLYNEPIGKKTVAFSKLPFGGFYPKSQQYNSARKEITDIIARLRTGAVINKEEENLYKTYVPGPTDSEANARWKIEQLKMFLNGLTIAGGYGASSPDILDLGANDPEYQAYLKSQGF